MSRLRVVVLGAGFGGLEVTAILSNKIADQLDLTLIDKNDSFYFGYSKLDVIFGRKTARSIQYQYTRINKPGVKFRQENILSIDPLARRIITDRSTYVTDVIVLALGADYDIRATPGLSETGYEFYSLRGAEKVRDILPAFEKGHALIGVAGFPFKCPPAPSETALLLDEYLTRRGLRQNCQISLVLPFEIPIPPSLGASKALLRSFKEKNIHFIRENMVGSIDPVRKTAELDDGSEIPFDLFLGIPEHCVPGVVKESGLVLDEWVPVDRNSMKTKYTGVYAIGDVSSAGIPKSGLFAKAAAEAAAESIIAEFLGQAPLSQFSGKSPCYMEFGHGQVGRADVDFFSNSLPRGTFSEASVELAEEKKILENQLKSRWFSLSSST